MTNILPLTAVRVDPRAVPATSLDRYIRNEFRERDAAWFAGQTRPVKVSRRPYRRRNGDRLIRRAARAIVTFLF